MRTGRLYLTNADVNSALTQPFTSQVVSLMQTFADKLHTFCIRLQTKMPVPLLTFAEEKPKMFHGIVSK